MQKKVLIVDDSPSQVRLIQGLLEPEGYWPVGLNDPKRVEEAIATERPSVILLDVIMPELTRRLARHASASYRIARIGPPEPTDAILAAQRAMTSGREAKGRMRTRS